MRTGTGIGEPFSEQLERWLRSDDTKTLGALSEVFAEKSFAVTVVLLMSYPPYRFPPVGSATCSRSSLAILAAEMVLGRRRVWLPERWQRRELGAATTEKAIPFMIRWIRRVERFSRPRGAWLFEQGWMLRLVGLLLMAFAIGADLLPLTSGKGLLVARHALQLRPRSPGWRCPAPKSLSR